MRPSPRLLVWGPRILGILVCLFLALFALDAFSEGKGIGEVLPDLAIHLIPAVLLLAVVIVSWNREWVAGVAFVVLGAVYAGMAGGRPAWILVISGPLLIVGVVFLWSWHHRDRTALKSAGSGFSETRH
jgi:hypothetical protein